MSIAAAMMVSSCTKTIREEIIVSPNIQNVTINVGKDKWAYSYELDNNFFYARVKVPELTRDAVKGGFVKMYRVYSNGKQEEMPYVRPIEYEREEGVWFFYTETVTYEFEEGWVTIYYTASDFEYEIDETIVPEAMQFRCVILN